MLNPYNPDTDSDGLTDAKDKNPRFKSKKTAKSILYEIRWKVTTILIKVIIK
jgi:hypothetical protein